MNPTATHGPTILYLAKVSSMTSALQLLSAMYRRGTRPFCANTEYSTCTRTCTTNTSVHSIHVPVVVLAPYLSMSGSRTLTKSFSDHLSCDSCFESIYSLPCEHPGFNAVLTAMLGNKRVSLPEAVMQALNGREHVWLWRWHMIPC